jgi:hypothetical protein
MGTETIWVNGKDKIRFSDDTNTYRFVADDKDVIKFTMDGNSTVIVLEGHGTIHSNGDLRIYLDKNQLTQPSEAKLKVFSGNGTEIFSVNERGGVHVLEERFEMDKPGTDDYILRVGRGVPGDLRGRAEIRQQPQQGLEGSEFFIPKKAGILALYDQSGRANFLWVDSNGKLRISRSDPGTDDVSGTVVGTQS